MSRLSLLPVLLATIAASASAQPPAAPHATFAVEVTGSGPDVVLVPGLSSSGPVWDGTVAAFSGTHTLHVVTLAGFGHVPPVEASTQDGFLDAVRDDLVAYVRALGRPAAVVGHSLGGWTALRVGAAAPEAVSHVVVVDAVPFLAAMQNPAATEAGVAEQGAQMLRMMALASPEQFRVQQEMALTGMITDPDTAAAYLDVHAASDPAAVAQAMHDMYTTDLRPLVPTLTTPTLVLAAGAGFGMMGPDGVRDLYDAQYGDGPAVRVEVVPGARHFIMLDQPAAFAAHLRAFLADDPATP
ncbi:alpha/beta fold hydrolase [Rubrivirga sp.]|uniref:alpha/beta fold hydrolase n=1 Tax=Rubrivirga sp. TaxID=1885344 RepID=UPI003B528080